MPVHPGQMLMHYRFVEKIGEGGMGVVWNAVDTKLDREVAIKTLPAELASDPERLGRFEREAKAVAALNHPNIVTVHSVEAAEGVHFITMELVRGKPLTELIPRHGLPLAKFFELSTALADAISAAHHQGITHRDLKPDNVMIGDDGRLKVLDFGLAKLREEARAVEGGTQLPTATVTQEGKILGTVSYMSPEQAEGKPIDHRSDIFSLGVMLYQMATGQRPFKGDTSVSIVSSIIKDTPASITELNQTLPRHLGRIVKHCLYKDPARRYHAAVDLRNDLEELKEEVDSGEVLPAGPVVSASATRRNWLRVGLGAVAVVALTLAIYQFTRQRPSEHEGATPFREMQITRVTSSGHSTAAAISADGKYVAHVVDDGGKASLWMTQVPTGSAVQVIPPVEAHIGYVVFSRSGDFLYYTKDDNRQGLLSYQELFRIPVLGGAPTKIVEDIDTQPSFSPDGHQFVFRRGTLEGDYHLMVANSEGSRERILATRKAPELYGVSSWSPDGKTIAAVAVDASGGMSVVEIPAEGGAERPISAAVWPDTGLFLQNVSWMPDGSGLVLTASEHGLVSSNQLWFLSYPDGPARRITNDLNAYLTVGLTADGSTLVSVAQETSFDLWAVSLEQTDRSVQITSGHQRDDAVGIAWTPDGRIVHGSNAGGSVDLWLRDADGGNLKQLTRDSRLNLNPSLSPDGRHIFFSSNRTADFHIWRIDLDGGNPTQVTQGTGERQARVSPDGQWLVYVRDEPGFVGSLWRMPVEGGQNDKFFEELSLASPVFSPDGTQIAFGFAVWTGEIVRNKTAIVPFEPAAKPSMIVDVAGRGGGSRLQWSNYIQWSHDGQALIYVKDEEGVSNIWSQPLSGGTARQLTHFESGRTRSIARSPDGKTLLFDRGRVTSDVVLLTGFR